MFQGIKATTHGTTSACMLTLRNESMGFHTPPVFTDFSRIEHEHLILERRF